MKVVFFLTMVAIALVRSFMMLERLVPHQGVKLGVANYGNLLPTPEAVLATPLWQYAVWVAVPAIIAFGILRSFGTEKN